MSMESHDVIAMLVGAGTIGLIIGGIIVALNKKNVITPEQCKKEQESCRKLVCTKMDAVKADIGDLKKGQGDVFKKFEALETKLENIFTFIGKVDHFMETQK